MITITAGALTTPFLQPSHCTSAFLSPGELSGASVDWINRDVTCGPSDVPTLAAACLPGWAVSAASLANWMEVVYSPGAACPIGHESVEDSSSTVVCCPSSYLITKYGDSRYCKSRPAYTSSSTTVYQCAGGTAEPVIVTILGSESFQQAIYSGSRTVVGDQMVYAMHIHLALNPSFPFTTFSATDQSYVATQTPISTFPSTETTPKGLPKAAIAGIAVGAVLFVTLLIIFLVALRRRKRQKARPPLPPRKPPLPPRTGQPNAGVKPELEGDLGARYGEAQFRKQELDATPHEGAVEPVELPIERDGTELPVTTIQGEGGCSGEGRGPTKIDVSDVAPQFAISSNPNSSATTCSP
ncbi:hypothetical protein K458DRAFT_490360 [Lentithecium fluviatile CBS 122367]|uniref:Uncharacterized protein n=1 Tax=Lentithecium fluviatile CBS 122367 TaxID=1168545 RepID=A0A6G1IN79_9PLEO|nr:hypothetical protein K458DRAFT_490360 [Lentithecium fluviatile CBS 122367]